eukprot:4337773-Prymnesium_polylepis.1
MAHRAAAAERKLVVEAALAIHLRHPQCVRQPLARAVHGRKLGLGRKRNGRFKGDLCKRAGVDCMGSGLAVGSERVRKVVVPPRGGDIEGPAARTSSRRRPTRRKGICRCASKALHKGVGAVPVAGRLASPRARKPLETTAGRGRVTRCLGSHAARHEQRVHLGAPGAIGRFDAYDCQRTGGLVKRDQHAGKQVEADLLEGALEPGDAQRGADRHPRSSAS